MSRRNHTFAINEYYHCYNRGTEKRVTFIDAHDYLYFLESMRAYNSTDVLGKLRLYKNVVPKQKIVDIVSYCILPNHFHFVLKEVVENGVSNFMKRVGLGYTMYFNEKYEHSGVLFQGTFKSKHIDSDQDLRQVIAYVINNNLVHNITEPKLYRSGLNHELDLVRGLNSSSMLTTKQMHEVVEIIKIQRLSFEE